MRISIRIPFTYRDIVLNPLCRVNVATKGFSHGQGTSYPLVKILGQAASRNPGNEKGTFYFSVRWGEVSLSSCFESAGPAGFDLVRRVILGTRSVAALLPQEIGNELFVLGLVML